MINTKTLLEIDNQIIDSRNYYDLQVYSSINNALPILTFKLRDDTGIYWNELNFSIGSVVRFAYLECTSDGTPTKVSYTTRFIIQKLYDGFELNNTETMGGYVQVNCIQAWNFYGDYLPHAYNCQKLGDLIKKICSNIKPEAGITVDSKNFEKSEDSGSIRYKTAMSDLEFITQRLLPFTSVDDSNALFYVNRTGVAYLSGFNTLYSKSEKLVICPTIDGIIGAEKELDAIKTKKNIKIHSPYISIESNIASNNDVIAQLKQKTYLYNHKDEEVIVGNQSLTIKLGKDAKKVKRTYTPVKKTIIERPDATGTFCYLHRNYEEQVALAKNRLISTNNLLSVEVYLGSFFPEVQIGDTIFLWIPPQTVPLNTADENGAIERSTDRKTHWLVGKWLIASEAVVTIAQGTVATRLTLMRPALNFEPENTTLSDYRGFYKILV